MFSHANGYPPGSYRVLLEALEETMDAPVVRHAHRPLMTDQPAPVFLSWHEYANDLIQRIERVFLKAVAGFKIRQTVGHEQAPRPNNLIARDKYYN